jgi:hypothetical protein
MRIPREAEVDAGRVRRRSELVETRTFGFRVVYVRYRRA